MLIELTVVTDIYSNPDKLGKTRLVRKNVQYKKQFYTEQITLEQCLSKKGNVIKGYTIVKEGEAYFRVKGKYEVLDKTINKERMVIKGFRQ